MPGPAPRNRRALREPVSVLVTILAGQSTANSADLGFGSLVAARVVCSVQQAAPDATAVAPVAVGNANGTVTVKTAANATADTVVAVYVDPR